MKLVAKTLMFAGTLLFSAHLCAQEMSLPQTQPKIHAMPFQTLESGTRSGCLRPAKMLLADEREWQRVLSIHKQGAEAKDVMLPAIDWSRQAVLVLLGGEVSGGAAAIELVQVVHTPAETVVYLKENAPPATEEKATKRTQPFHFALIEKPKNPPRFVNLAVEKCATCVLGFKQP